MDQKHELVPLELATRAVYRRVYEAQHVRAGITCGPELLNGIAYAIAALLPLYAYPDGTDDARALQSEELFRGLFREGGRAMIFLDGRPPLARLAVESSGLEQVVQALAGHGAP